MQQGIQHAACSMHTTSVDNWNQIKCRGTSSAARWRLPLACSPHGRAADERLGQARPSAADEASARLVVLVIPFLSRNRRVSSALRLPRALARLCFTGSASNTRYLLHWFLVTDRRARAGSTSTMEGAPCGRAGSKSGLLLASRPRRDVRSVGLRRERRTRRIRRGSVRRASASPLASSCRRQSAAAPAPPPLARKAFLSFVRYLSSRISHHRGGAPRAARGRGRAASQLWLKRRHNARRRGGASAAAGAAAAAGRRDRQQS